MADFNNEQDQRIGKLRISANARSTFSSSGGVRRPAVRVQGLGKHRYHRGSKAVHKAGGRLNAHLRYAAGLRKDQIEKGTSNDRQLYDANGNKVSLEKAMETHNNNTFIEHRPQILPRDSTVEDLHILAQAAIQKIQSDNPQAEVRASYAIHTDTRCPHAHLVITSPNKLELRRDDYNQLREQSKDLLGELYRERGQEITHKKENEHEQAADKNIEQNQAEELGQER